MEKKKIEWLRSFHEAVPMCLPVGGAMMPAIGQEEQVKRSVLVQFGTAKRFNIDPEYPEEVLS